MPKRKSWLKLARRVNLSNPKAERARPTRAHLHLFQFPEEAEGQNRSPAEGIIMMTGDGGGKRETGRFRSLLSRTSIHK